MLIGTLTKLPRLLFNLKKVYQKMHISKTQKHNQILKNTKKNHFILYIIFIFHHIKAHLFFFFLLFLWWSATNVISLLFVYFSSIRLGLTKYVSTKTFFSSSLSLSISLSLFDSHFRCYHLLTSFRFNIWIHFMDQSDIN